MNFLTAYIVYFQLRYTPPSDQAINNQNQCDNQQDVDETAADLETKSKRP